MIQICLDEDLIKSDRYQVVTSFARRRPWVGLGLDLITPVPKDNWLRQISNVRFG